MKMSRLLMAVSISLTFGFLSCSPKNSDTDIKTEIETKLKAAPGMAGIIVDVKNGIVTVTGECSVNDCGTKCEKIAQDVKGVKTVINNLTTAIPPAITITPTVTDTATRPETVMPEDPFNRLVEGAIKKFPAVKAEVKDSIITLTGEIKKTDLPKLIKSLSSLKPKKIEQKLTVVKNTKKKQPKHKKRSRRR